MDADTDVNGVDEMFACWCALEMDEDQLKTHAILFARERNYAFGLIRARHLQNKTCVRMRCSGNVFFV